MIALAGGGGGGGGAGNDTATPLEIQYGNYNTNAVQTTTVNQIFLVMMLQIELVRAVVLVVAAVDMTIRWCTNYYADIRWCYVWLRRKWHHSTI